MRQSGKLLSSSNKVIPAFEPTISFLSTYPRETNTYAHKETCTRIFTAASFTLAPNWKENVHQLVNSYTAVHPYHGTVLSDTKEQTSDTHNDLTESPKCQPQQKKPGTKDYILGDPHYKKF